MVSTQHNVPKFGQRKDLARYIDNAERLSGNRISSAAFRLNPGPPKETYLSVNSLETEPIADIANYYREEIEKTTAAVAISVQKVASYNDAGRFSGATITFSRSIKQWEFLGPTGAEPAYRHRPVKRTHGRDSPSHCGVEFLRTLDQLAERKFSRRMARNRFHWF